MNYFVYVVWIREDVSLAEEEMANEGSGKSIFPGNLKIVRKGISSFTDD